MLKQNAKNLLPSSVHQNLENLFEIAEKKLATSKNSSIHNWPTKVAVCPAGFQLTKPNICDDSLKVIENALVNKKRLQLDYIKRPTTEIKPYKINPLGLIIRGNALYLVATLIENDDYRLFALHRVQKATELDSAAKIPSNFNLQNYINDGKISFLIKKGIELVLKVENKLGHHMKEMKLSDDQQIMEQGDNFFIIKATVNHSEELRWWLMSVADFTEVISLQYVRDDLLNYLHKSISNYKKQAKKHL